MTRNSWVSAFICGSHICKVQPSEFDSIRVGPPSRPSTDTLSRQPSASIIGIVCSSSARAKARSASLHWITRASIKKEESIEEDGLPGQARQRHLDYFLSSEASSRSIRACETP